MKEKKERPSNPIISVIVPVYNVENYLATLLDSLLNQSEKSIEIIAINDGSTDSSSQILQDFANKDSRIVLINQKNSGTSCARNTGLKQAKGKWLAFADSDDWLSPVTLEHWLKQAEKYHLDFLLGNGFKFNTNPLVENTPENLLLKQEPWDKVITGKEWIIQSVSENKWRHNVWLQLLKTEFVRTHNLQFKENITHEDILWTLNLALCAERVGFCQKALYGYRRTPDSILTSNHQKIINHRAESYIDVFYGLINAAINNHQKPLRKALFKHLNFEVANFMVLIRKKTSSPSEQHKLAKKMLALKPILPMLKGADNASELWRVIRSWLFLYQIFISTKA